ncbi:uncharacterized protein LOC103749263 isoform X2 [Nannospalax galili]|uniref:uncharacterized protein LOC103749263 isoform X2 n=1 Tax=Nannospalax galili TaxID=1026970 RepID=UPI00111C5EB9|nr:uncharacterized protein LOC103749263 isoform X2 [Nannospalax galili]
MLMPSPPALALRTVTRRRWSSSASGNCGGAAPGSAVPLNCAGSGSGPGSPSAGLTVSTSSARLSSPGCHRSPPAPKPAGVRSSSSPVRGARLPDAIFASERPRAATLPCPTVLGPFQPRTQGRWRRGQLGQRAPYPWPPGAGLLGAGPTGRGHGWERRMSCSPGVLRMRCGGSEGRRDAAAGLRVAQGPPRASPGPLGARRDHHGNCLAGRRDPATKEALCISVSVSSIRGSVGHL